MSNLSQTTRGENIYYRLDIDDLDHNAMPEYWRTVIKSMDAKNISTGRLLFTNDALETRMADVYWEQETGLGCVKWMNWYPPREVL